MIRLYRILDGKVQETNTKQFQISNKMVHAYLSVSREGTFNDVITFNDVVAAERAIRDVIVRHTRPERMIPCYAGGGGGFGREGYGHLYVGNLKLCEGHMRGGGCHRPDCGFVHCTPEEADVLGRELQEPLRFRGLDIWSCRNVSTRLERALKVCNVLAWTDLDWKEVLTRGSVVLGFLRTLCMHHVPSQEHRAWPLHWRVRMVLTQAYVVRARLHGFIKRKRRAMARSLFGNLPPELLEIVHELAALNADEAWWALAPRTS